jgi:hypothetical protein
VYKKAAGPQAAKSLVRRSRPGGIPLVISLP